MRDLKTSLQYKKTKSMNEAGKERLLMLRNLKDAGFGSAPAEKFFQFGTEGKHSEQLRLLAAQRAVLLKKLHRDQKKIDCLDFLVFNIDKTSENQIRPQANKNRRNKE